LSSGLRLGFAKHGKERGENGGGVIGGLAWAGAKASNEFVEFFGIPFGNENVPVKVSEPESVMTSRVHTSEEKKTKKRKEQRRGRAGCWACWAGVGLCGLHARARKAGPNLPGLVRSVCNLFLFLKNCFLFLVLVLGL
jgi:hypothetical protein